MDNIYVYFHLINNDCQHSPKVKDILGSSKRIGKVLQIKPSTPAILPNCCGLEMKDKVNLTRCDILDLVLIK